MVHLIGHETRRGISELIIEKERKISIIVDESTSLSKKSCLVVYLLALIDETPQNLFLDICELDGEDAASVKRCLVDCLAKHGFNSAFSSKHFISFTSDGAVMLICNALC